MIIKLTPEQTDRCLQRLHNYLIGIGPWEEATKLRLAGIKTTSVVCNRSGLEPVLRRQLDWCMESSDATPDSTIFLWEDSSLDTFHQRVLGLDIPLEDNYLSLVTWDGKKMSAFAGFGVQDGFFSIWDGDKQYCCVRSLLPEELLKTHLFALNFSRLVDTSSTSMVHGACVGTDGKGILLCGRGGRGKSTLTISCLFQGMEYVAEDYLILKKEAETLRAFPIYCSTALTPQIYNRLYVKLGPTRFIGLNGRMNKYMLDISGWHNQVRRDYPVRACVFPEIAAVEEPYVIPCTPQEKGRTITHIVHSTLEQIMQTGNSEAVRKLLGMLSGMDYYRIVLSPDLTRNSECLRSFIESL